MYTKKQIESMLSKPRRYTGYSIPDVSLLTKIEQLGVDATLMDGIDAVTKEHFAFCWAQKAFFAGAVRNAVEIAYCLGVRPIYVAMLIHVYGLDWHDKAWVKRRRFPKVDEFRLFQHRGYVWSIRAIKEFHHAHSGVRRVATQHGYDEVVGYVSRNGGCLVQHLVDDIRPLFTDPFNTIKAKPGCKPFAEGNTRVYQRLDSDYTGVVDLNFA